MTQAWQHVVFLHWSVGTDVVRPMLPPHTRPDTFDGHAYVGMVALRVADSRLGGVMPLGHFLQINIRVYGIDDAGRQGAVFRSMDVSRIDAAVAGRCIAQQPFHWSVMSFCFEESGLIRYRCRRRSSSEPATSVLDLQIGEPVDNQDPFARFVTARWGLYSPYPSGVCWVPVVHRPWKLYAAELLRCDAGLVRAAGFAISENTPPASVLYSPGALARVGRPSRVGVATSRRTSRA